jgi:hypothetical protein
MSFPALKAWHALDPAQVERVRMETDPKRRPSLLALVAVCEQLALGVIDGKGYTDLTVEQIRKNLHGALSRDQVQNALTCAEGSLFVTVRRSTRGKHGKAGRAPRRVAVFYDSVGHLTARNHDGANPVLNQGESSRGTGQIMTGYGSNHDGANPVTLIQNPYTKPLGEQVTEQAQPVSASCTEKGKKAQKEIDPGQALPCSHAELEAIVQGALERAAQAPGFTPGKGWWVTKRTPFRMCAIGLLSRYPDAPAGAIAEATAIEAYNELDPYKHADLIARLEGQTVARHKQSPGIDLSAVFQAVPADPDN